MLLVGVNEGACKISIQEDLAAGTIGKEEQVLCLARVSPPGQHSQDKVHGLSTRLVNRDPFILKQ